MRGTVKDHVPGFTHHQAPRLSSQATLSWEALGTPRGKLLDPAWGAACDRRPPGGTWCPGLRALATERAHRENSTERREGGFEIAVLPTLFIRRFSSKASL